MADILDEAGNDLLDELSAIIADELGITGVGVAARRGLFKLGLGLSL